MEKKTNKAKLEHFPFFLENRLNHKAITFDKISRNFAFYENSIDIHLLEIFLHARIHFYDENSAK